MDSSTTFLDLVNNHAVRPPIGTFVKMNSVEVIEMLNLAGFDFIVIDFEHSMLSTADLNHMLALTLALDMPTLVRVADHQYGYVQKILDAGASGLFFPHVSNAEECQTVIRQAVHPPNGSRGAGGGMRAAEWGMTERGRAEYATNGLHRVARIPMIEELNGVRNAKEILGIPGVSAVFIGPADLTMSMGVFPNDPALQVSIRQTFEAAKECGVPVGSVAGDVEGARRLSHSGYDFVMVSSDAGMFGKITRDSIRGYVAE